MKGKMKRKKPTKMKMINLVVGDWSDDGHGRTHTVTVESNFDVARLGKAFKAGTKKLKFNIAEHCQDYEDGSISDRFAAALTKHGFDLTEMFSYDGPDEPINLSPSDFADIWLFTAELGGGKKLRLKIVEPDDIHVGGYGCFL